jgi:hypothetical protein
VSVLALCGRQRVGLKTGGRVFNNPVCRSPVQSLRPPRSLAHRILCTWCSVFTRSILKTPLLSCRSGRLLCLSCPNPRTYKSESISVINPRVLVQHLVHSLLAWVSSSSHTAGRTAILADQLADQLSSVSLDPVPASKSTFKSRPRPPQLSSSHLEHEASSGGSETTWPRTPFPFYAGCETRNVVEPAPHRHMRNKAISSPYARPSAAKAHVSIKSGTETHGPGHDLATNFANISLTSGRERPRSTRSRTSGDVSKGLAKIPCRAQEGPTQPTQNTLHHPARGFVGVPFDIAGAWLEASGLQTMLRDVENVL